MTISEASLLDVPAFRDHGTGGPGAHSFPGDDAHAPIPVYGATGTKDLPRGDLAGWLVGDKTLPCSSGQDPNHHKSDNRCNGGGMHHAALPDVPKTKD